MGELRDPAVLAAAIRVGMREHADPEYVAGTVAARHPGKAVLGVRIPLLRGAVRAALGRAVPNGVTRDETLIRGAADVLWHGDAHEDELAACMLLRLADVAPAVAVVRRWAPALDNWLSVDEFGGVIGAAVHAGQLRVEDLGFAARAVSPWQRRLYLVALITPMRRGLDPAVVPMLGDVLVDAAKPVRKAATWLIASVVKDRPDAADRLCLILPGPDPKPLVRLLHAAVA